MREGGEKRGNCYDRHARKRWLLGAVEDRNLGFAPYGGNGSHVNCVHCGLQLDYDTVEADRIVPGGPYTRQNVQPSCRPCNSRRSNDPERFAQERAALAA